MEPNKNIIAPVRIKIEKEKWYNTRKGAAICLLIFILGISIVAGYSDAQDRKEMKEQQSFGTVNPQQVDETFCPLNILNNTSFETIQDEL